MNRRDSVATVALVEIQTIALYGCPSRECMKGDPARVCRRCERRMLAAAVRALASYQQRGVLWWEE